MNEENGTVVLFCNTDEEKEKEDQITNPGFHLPSLRSAWDLVYLVQNRDFREILRNLIGRLEDWELENIDFSRKIKTPDWCIANRFNL